MESTLGIKSEETEQLFNEDQDGVTRWTTGGLDQRFLTHFWDQGSSPCIRVLFQNFVKNLGAESHSAFHLQNTLLVKPCSTAVSLINPLRPGPGGSGHLLLKAIINDLPTHTPLPQSPDQRARFTERPFPASRWFSSQKEEHLKAVNFWKSHIFVCSFTLFNKNINTFKKSFIVSFLFPAT